MALSTQQRILHAARQVFIERGKDGARVDAIARRGKVNKALIYYYFSSKDQLYYYVLRDTFSLILARVSGALEPSKPPEERLRQMANAYHSFLMENRDFPRLILREIAAGAPVLRKIAHEMLKGDFENLPRSFEKTLKEGNRQGLWKSVDSRHALVSFLGMLIFPFVAAPLLENALGIKPDNPFWQERPGAVLELFFHGIQRRDTE